ncbi:c-type cytochrome [uncultured Thiodictyon sp.]|uniref:c-type cytochrome n=1 Tax=uncultured Thiodictyon sp. TaxID=1846217 RepID=UPI0025EE4174|nr:c-type cytochrome [uncultured Thiodictyon sp.]
MSSHRIAPRRHRPTALAVGLALLACLTAGAPATTPPADPDALVERGQYLATAGDCISCHTAPGGKPLAGGDRLNTPFGYLLAPNITPDDATGIGRWSADDFYRAMHEGVNRAGQDMYPAMPYTFYTRVTREDSDAIYRYLRTREPVRRAIDINHLRFPFNQRWTMAFWRELYFDAGTFQPAPDQSAQRNRGAYLVEGLGHCSACHSPRNLLGGIEERHEYTGAEIDGWFAPNLSSNLSVGLGAWSAEDIATYLKTGVRKGHTTSFGPMAEVVHNSTRHLTDADLAAMALYLKSLPPGSPLRAAKTSPPESRVRGAALFMDHCSACHQSGGRGIPGVFPPLAGNGAVIARDPGNILQAILRGIPMQNGYIAMPAFVDQLSDRQIAEVANYVRTSWSNGALPNATPADVARLRAALPK